MPSLRDAFVSAERWVANAVVELVDTPAVAGALLDAGKLGAVGARTIDDLRSGVVHLLSLPSHRDLRALSAEVARLRTQLTEVTAQLEDMQLAAPPAQDRGEPAR
jgi:hypothetical protein